MTKEEKLEAIRRAVIQTCYEGRSFWHDGNEYQVKNGNLEMWVITEYPECGDNWDFEECEWEMVDDFEVTLGFLFVVIIMMGYGIDDFTTIENAILFWCKYPIGWQLLNNDGSKATLKDQPEETINVIYIITCKR